MTPQEIDRIEDAISELQSAIDLIKQDGKDWLDERDIPILEMAISALQAQDSPKQTAGSVQNVQNEDLISRKAAIDAECEVCQIAPKKERGHNCTYYVHGCKEIECLRVLPSAQPEIVRCKECKYRGGLSGFYCDIVEKAVGVDSFCSWAERRTDGRD